MKRYVVLFDTITGGFYRSWQVFGTEEEAERYALAHLSRQQDVIGWSVEELPPMDNREKLTTALLFAFIVACVLFVGFIDGSF